MPTPILDSHIPGFPKTASGKVRDLYDLSDTLLLVVSDRISAYDVVMPNGIPDKGKVLTQITRFWLRLLRPLVPTHYITCDIDFIAARLAEKSIDVSPDTRAMLDGRSMLAIKAEVFPVECVARGYISGSLWKEYVDAGGREHEVVINGVALPAGLQESDRLPQPIFTPATKAETGHDENIDFETFAKTVGDQARAEQLRETTLRIYSTAAEWAKQRGLLIADTKFEFGMHKGVLTLIDEVLTPDSSRFWAENDWKPGGPQASFDKQYLRDWLNSTGWDRTPPAPELPADVIANTSAKYREAYTRITGSELP